MINQRSTEVGKQDRQHHALGERRVDHADEHHHDADQDAGSVAMKIMPKAKPPVTMCQYQGMENIGLVSEPMKLNRVLSATMPIITPATMRQEAILVSSSTAPPMKMARVLVSPIEPCM